MRQVRTVYYDREIATPYVEDAITAGEFVLCGPVGAVWRVERRLESDRGVEFTLVEANPHDVPLDGLVLELPRPLPGGVL
jgi:hypothetical protein